MNYAEIKYNDIANGIGVRTSLFVSGCSHHCKGCFNEIAWDYNYGEEFTNDILDNILNSLKPDYIAGLSILGGEPLDPKNAFDVASIAIAVKNHYPEKDIWLYTGYNFDDIYKLYQDIINISVFPRHNCRQYVFNCRKYAFYLSLILNSIDVLVDGKFEEDKKDITLKFRGSSNQRIIDVKQSLLQHKIVEYEI